MPPRLRFAKQPTKGQVWWRLVELLIVCKLANKYINFPSVDPVANPFAPGAGAPPPELAGRDQLRETVRVALERVRLGLPAKSMVLVGLRGVGKTVLLDRMRVDAEAAGLQTVASRRLRGRSLPACSHPSCGWRCSGSLATSGPSSLRRARCRGTRRILPRALKVKYQDIEVGIDFDPEPGSRTTATSSMTCRRCSRSSGEAARNGGHRTGAVHRRAAVRAGGPTGRLIMALHRSAPAPVTGHAGGRRSAAAPRPDGAPSPTPSACSISRRSARYPTRRARARSRDRSSEWSQSARKRSRASSRQTQAIPISCRSGEARVGGGGRFANYCQGRRAGIRGAVAALDESFSASASID